MLCVLTAGSWTLHSCQWVEWTSARCNGLIFFSPFHAGVEWTSARVHRFIFSPLCAKWHKIQFLKFEKENKKCAVFLFY
jgi:hypothetical protein